MAKTRKATHKRRGDEGSVPLKDSSMSFCRICLEYGTENGDELISPCMCKGTQQFVHRTCLNQWRTMKEGFAFSHCTTCKSMFHLRVIELRNSWRKTKFRLLVARDLFLAFLAMQCVIAAIGCIGYFLDKGGRFRNSFSASWIRALSKNPIAFFYCFGFIEFLVIAGLLGRMMQWIYQIDDPRMARVHDLLVGWGLLDFIPESIEELVAFMIVSFVFFVIVGIVFSFLTIAFAVQRIWQRRYDMLNKKQLSEEFVVEDLKGIYTPPTLNPEHERRLRTLNLM